MHHTATRVATEHGVFRLALPSQPRGRQTHLDQAARGLVELAQRILFAAFSNQPSQTKPNQSQTNQTKPNLSQAKPTRKHPPQTGAQLACAVPPVTRPAGGAGGVHDARHERHLPSERARIAGEGAEVARGCGDISAEQVISTCLVHIYKI